MSASLDCVQDSHYVRQGKNKKEVVEQHGKDQVKRRSFRAFRSPIASDISPVSSFSRLAPFVR